jgi:CubicO group peptidase (beta-lactamase class C family)
MRTFWIIPLAAVSLLAADVDEIRSLLENRIDASHKAVGIVAGIIDQNGRQVVGRGKLATDRTQTPDGDTVFEIGSVTKVFTSLLLADMIERGEVKPDDAIAKFLPSSVKVLRHGDREITLLDLSMQVSGLPRVPDNLHAADPANPYADYDATRLYEFLSGYTLTRSPGEMYEYSNLGGGLLGHILALKAGMSYEQLLRQRILQPLKMDETSITLSAGQKQRLAQGYDAALEPVKNWDFDALAGAGALRSTVNDMLKFLAANLELSPSPLQAAMRRMRSVSHATGMPELDIAMGWHIWRKFETDLVWHNGGTLGYRSFAGFEPSAKKGAVVLCNTFLDIDDIGRHLVDGRYQVAALSPPKQAIQIDPKILETYVGVYELAPGFSVAITREGSRLFGQATGQPRFEMFAQKDTEFFLRVVDAQITFVRDETGKVTHLILHQNGIDQKGRKGK